MKKCPCGSGNSYANCCEPLLKGEKKAATAEELMRSRYSAYVNNEVDYLIDTVHPKKRKDHDAEGIRAWSEKSEWHSLEILNTSMGGQEDVEGEVEFVARYSEKGNRHNHHELAYFKKKDDTWFFMDGQPPESKPFVHEAPKVGRNEPCPCGSGKKFKKCCIA